MSDKNRFIDKNDAANLEKRESDLSLSLFSSGVGAVGESIKYISTPNWIGTPSTGTLKSPIEGSVNASMNTTIRTATHAEENQKDYLLVLQDVIAISIDYKLDTIVDVPKSIKKMKRYIKGLSALNVLLTIRGLIDVGRKFTTGEYSIKNNLIDFNGDNYLNTREYDLSMKILREAIIYDIYANIVLPFAQMFPYVEIASYVFDPILKASHLEFGKDILTYMGEDEIYELYGFGRDEILVGSDGVVTNKQMVRSDVISEIDDLRELIYGEKIEDIIKKPYCENVFDEVFMLLQEEGDFKENIKLMNKIFVSNPDENAIDIANFIAFTRKNNNLFENMINKNITNQVYNSYMAGEDIFDLGLDSTSEVEQLRNYFDYYYPPNSYSVAVENDYRFQQVLEHNNKLKNLGYSKKSRQRTMLTLFNNYDFHELGTFLDVDNTSELYEQISSIDELRSTDALKNEKIHSDDSMKTTPVVQEDYNSQLNLYDELMNEKLWMKNNISIKDNSNPPLKTLKTAVPASQTNYNSQQNSLDELIKEKMIIMNEHMEKKHIITSQEFEWMYQEILKRLLNELKANQLAQ